MTRNAKLRSFLARRLLPPFAPFALQPIAKVRDKGGFEQAMTTDAVRAVREAESRISRAYQGGPLAVAGICGACEKYVDLEVDMLFGGRRDREGRCVPNWRERLVCPCCRMNNRQRLVATLVGKRLGCSVAAKRIYAMERVTPMFRWLEDRHPRHDLIGSEYLGHRHESGTTLQGIRHEDAMHLSFDTESVDLIVSNDVFEHVPDPSKAFRECARVLTSGGKMLATIPFTELDKTTYRARLGLDGVDHMEPPRRHGNPISEKGSLVFAEFGWDCLDMLREAGFADAWIELYASVERGHLGGAQLVFMAEKRRARNQQHRCTEPWESDRSGGAGFGALLLMAAGYLLNTTPRRLPIRTAPTE